MMQIHPRPAASPRGHTTRSLRRIQWWYMGLIIVGAIFVVRLFYLQVIRHDYYQRAAFKSQLKEYDIPAQRGTIMAYNGTSVVPLVLNENLYTLYADPTFITDPTAVARSLAAQTGGNANDYEALLKKKQTRYVVLAKKLNKEQRDRIAALELKGVGTREVPYRTYPDGSLASQVLGFVNDDGEGKYGLEQALEKTLSGTPGRLKAITDSQGIPLPANKDNTVTEPKHGQQLTLTLDIGMQQQLEDLLATNVKDTKAKSGSALIISAKTGAVKAMANYPTFDPARYAAVEDGTVFNNDAVSSPLEVGSIMKALTAAAALDQRVVNKDTSYYDPSFFKVDDAIIKNVEEDGGAGTKNVADILQLSLNTGATWLLMQMGGGEINAKARTTWHDYMTNHYRLGKPTGIEVYETAGYIPEPNKGFGLDITYANTAFGQGMSATPLQMAAAFNAAVNGGTYYRPHLIAAQKASDGSVIETKPMIENSQVVQDDVSATLRDMLEYTFRKNQNVYTSIRFPEAYSVGGKTGTAQITKPEGGYYDDRYNGTYVGFVGGNEPEYIIAVRISEPRVPGYAGAKAAAPLFARLANMLITNYDVTPRT